MILSTEQTIIECIAQRRAVFPVLFNQNPVTRQELEIVLEAANWAPSHRHTEPWRFKVIQGETREKLGDFMAETYKKTAAKFSARKYEKIKEKCLQSSAVIAICMQRDLQERVPEWEELAATAMAVQNLWLAAGKLNIGGYWSSPAIRTHLGEFTPLKEGETCLGFFYLGHYDPQILPEGHREPWQEKVEWL